MTSKFSPGSKIDAADGEVNLDSLPQPLRDNLQRLIARKVEVRLMLELDSFRNEVKA